MLLRVAHTTRYLYKDTVSLCHSEAHLTPRMRPGQTLLEHEIVVSPGPDYSATREDYFGNEVTAFSIEQPHRDLTVTARSLVEIACAEPPRLDLSPPWEQARDDVREMLSLETFEAGQFVYASPLVETGPAFAEFAEASFAPERPLLEAVDDLSHRIHTDFQYDPRATTVTTPVAEALAARRGVCQDYAQVMIACLRSLGVAARYVSGYVRGGGGLTGAEASHAWVSVYCPLFGWQDFDPTNNVRPHGEHVTLGWGRDYSDVTPIKGVALGGGEQIISVSVDVSPQPV